MTYELDLRGKLIIGQALGIAIEELEKVEGVHRQISNIEDMKLFLKSGMFINLNDEEEK